MEHYFGIPPRVMIWMFTGFWAGIVIGFLTVRVMERGFDVVLQNDTVGLIVIVIGSAAGFIGLIAGGIRQIRYERIRKDSALYYDTDKRRQFRKEAGIIILINLVFAVIFILLS